MPIYATPPPIIIQVGDERPVPLTIPMRREYERLYKTQKLNPLFKKRLDINVDKIKAGTNRYVSVSAQTNIPWYIVGVIHLMECDCRFDCHLHNGDPIGKKTVNVPKGRPLLKHWEWEDSAVDALQIDALDTWNDWSIGGTLYKLEAYNGFGYRNRGIVSPYLWSGTRHYVRGKYRADGKWDSKLVSQQVGAALILKTMNDTGLITFPESLTLPKPVEIKLD